MSCAKSRTDNDWFKLYKLNIMKLIFYPKIKLSYARREVCMSVCLSVAQFCVRLSERTIRARGLRSKSISVLNEKKVDS